MRLAIVIAALFSLLPFALQAKEAGGPVITPDRLAEVFEDYGLAQPEPAPEMAQGMQIYQALPQSVRDALSRFGPDHLDFAEDLITGYGDIDRIDLTTLEAYVGFQRAGMRGGAADVLISADLNGDGVIGAREKAQAMGMLSSGLRSRLARTHEAADLNKDGTVSAAELAAYPDAYALQRFGTADAERILGLMAFDLNGDGWVELPELREGLRALEDSGAADGGGIKLLIGG